MKALSELIRLKGPDEYLTLIAEEAVEVSVLGMLLLSGITMHDPGCAVPLEQCN
jgi:hypothetical protein